MKYTPMETDYFQTHEHLKWTFESDKIRNWVEERIEGRVLNACAGETSLSHSGEIVRNDIDTERPADYHTDVAKLASILKANSFDTVVFDPPWTLYQANMRYDGKHVTKDGVKINTDELPQKLQSDKTQIGHARLAKDGFDYLLRPRGKVIQLSYTATCMPSRLGYKRIERVMIDPLGEGKTLIGSVDEKRQHKLTEM